MSSVRALYSLPRDLVVVDLEKTSLPEDYINSYFTSNQHTFAELVEFFWRVKSWAFTEGTFTRVSQQEDEQQLVCKYNYGLYGQQWPSGANITLAITVPWTAVWKLGDRYAPTFFRSGVGSIIWPRLVTKTGRLQYSFLTYWQVNPYNLNFPNPDNFQDFTVNMTPAEYWPYDPEDGGGPIYDTATGAQLRAFPS
jgi:hypothetical protein